MVKKSSDRSIDRTYGIATSDTAALRDDEQTGAKYIPE
jgi:hypothetical protein